MPPIEIGPTRPVGAVQVKTFHAAATPAAAPVRTETQPSAATPVAAAPKPSPIETSDAVKGGAAPVDAERVETIRRAIQEGRYPVVPTKIADAMIAAGMLLRSAQ